MVRNVLESIFWVVIASKFKIPLDRYDAALENHTKYIAQTRSHSRNIQVMFITSWLILQFEKSFTEGKTDTGLIEKHYFIIYNRDKLAYG
jgi:hypothetical protein